MNGLRNLHHFLNVSVSQQKPIVTWSFAFYGTSGTLFYFFFTLSSHWLPVIIAHALIGWSDHYYQGYLGGAENEGIQNKTLLADKKLNTLVTPEIEMHNER